MQPIGHVYHKFNGENWEEFSPTEEEKVLFNDPRYAGGFIKEGDKILTTGEVWLRAFSALADYIRKKKETNES